MKGAKTAEAKGPSIDLGSPATANDDPARTTLAFNPLIGLRSEDLGEAAKTVLKAVITQPTVAGKAWLGFLGSLSEIVSGNTDSAPNPTDKRFADPTWSKSWLHKGLWQTYVAWGAAVNEFVAKAELSDIDRQRAGLVGSIIVDAMAPSNMLMANPVALRKIIDTGGESLLSGVKNFVTDMTVNKGLPSSVDKSKFKVGTNLATSKGGCVFRNEMIELIQYAPQTGDVHARPMLMVPPQINKYYSIDLSPDKSLIRYLTHNSIRPFCISWRNPTAKQRHWGLQDYIAAVDEAVDATREITGSKDVNMFGACSGGITASTYAGYLAAGGEKKINALVLAVCVLDTATSTDTQFGSLMTPQTVEAARAASRLKGVLEGDELARVFAWMRPNDLIWNYWVNNYLLGNQPPAFDVLFWNADTTRLPAQLHSDYLDLIETNPFVNSGAMKINGRTIDMTKVDLETYVVGGTTDHITPWRACYKSGRIYRDKSTFVLSNSGHLQSLLNPPGNPKSFFLTGASAEEDPDAWASKAQKHPGSWWPHWAEWLGGRSGDKIAAPTVLGSDRHPPICPAPGTYIFEA